MEHQESSSHPVEVSEATWSVSDPNAPPNYQMAAMFPAHVLNNLLGDLFGIFRETYFKGEIEITDPVMLKVNYDVRRPPRLTLNDRADAEDAFRQLTEAVLAEHPDLNFSAGQVASELVGPLVATFHAEEIAATLRFQGADPVEIRAGARFSCVPETYLQEGRWQVRPKLVVIRVVMPDDPVTEEFLNREVTPKLVPLLNKEIAAVWKLPPLDLGNIRFSAPELRAGEEILFAYGAMERTGATTAPAPYLIGDRRRVALAIDASLADAIAAIFIDPLRWKAGPYVETISIGPLKVEFSAELQFGLSRPRFTFRPGNVADGELHLDGSGFARFSAGPFVVRAGVRVKATPVVTAQLFIQQGVLGFWTILLRRWLHIDFRFDFPPGWFGDLINGVISGVVSLIATPFFHTVAVIFTLLKIPLVPLPKIEIKQGGIVAEIRLDQLGVNTLATPDGKTLGYAHGVLVGLRKESV